MSEENSNTRINGRGFFVTGGAGFIGSHLVDALLAYGARRVFVIDDLRTGYTHNVPHDDRVELVEEDFSTIGRRTLCAALRDSDVVYHLAAVKHQGVTHDPSTVIEVNIGGSARLFTEAASNSIEKVVFTSSLYAHGRMQGDPMREEDRPEPSTVYGITKLAGEHLLRSAAIRSGLRTTSLRLFFVYGPRQYARGGYKSVIIRSFQRMLADEPPVVRGDGEQSLDYVYVADVVRALILSLGPAADSRLFNVGSGVEVKVRDLIEMMIDIAGYQGDPLSEPADWTAGTNRVSDPSAIELTLGWRAETTLVEGLRRVYEWMTEQKCAGLWTE